MEQALVDLRGMTRAVAQEVDAPWQLGGLAVAAAVAKASPAADDERECEGQGKSVAGLDADLQGELGQLDAEVGADQPGGDRLAVAEPQRQPTLIAYAEKKRQLGRERAADEPRQ